MGWGGEKRESSIPHKPQQKGKEATTNDKLLRWRDPTGEEGQLGAPPSACASLFPTPPPTLCTTFSSPSPFSVPYSVSPIFLSLSPPVSLGLPSYFHPRGGRGGGRGGGAGACPSVLTRDSFLSAHTSARAVEEETGKPGWLRSGHGDPTGALATRLGRAAAGLVARTAPRYVGQGWVAWDQVSGKDLWLLVPGRQTGRGLCWDLAS